MATITRPRMINPAMWDNEGFNQLSHSARLLWIGLISNADDLGRGSSNSQSLKNKIFPFDKISLKKVEKWRQEVKKMMKNVKFYRIKGKEFYQLLKWEEYQYLRKDRIRMSKIPQPRGYQITTNKQPNDGIEEKEKRIEREEKRDTSLNKFYNDAYKKKEGLIKEVLKDKLKMPKE